MEFKILVASLFVPFVLPILAKAQIIIDTQPPTYSLNSTNSTLAGTSIMHSLFWEDDSGLSYAIFSFDNCTGSFINISETGLSGTSAWSNFTVVVNSTVGCRIRWRVYANDTSNNWNVSEIFSYQTTSLPPKIVRRWSFAFCLKFPYLMLTENGEIKIVSLKVCIGR